MDPKNERGKTVKHPRSNDTEQLVKRLNKTLQEGSGSTDEDNKESSKED